MKKLLIGVLLSLSLLLSLASCDAVTVEVIAVTDAVKVVAIAINL